MADEDVGHVRTFVLAKTRQPQSKREWGTRCLVDPVTSTLCWLRITFDDRRCAQNRPRGDLGGCRSSLTYRVSVSRKQKATLPKANPSPSLSWSSGPARPLPLTVVPFVDSRSETEHLLRVRSHLR